MTSAIEKVGAVHQPKLNETLRIGASIATSLILSFAAVSDPTPTVARNVKSLAMLMVSMGISGVALLDAIKPDKDKEARKTIELVKHEADVIVAEATEYFARLHPTQFVNGVRPSDSFIESFARNLIEQEGDLLALPQSESIEFNPSITELETTKEFEYVETVKPTVSQSTIRPTVSLPIESHKSFVIPKERDDEWLDRLIAPSVLLVFGGDGSGKTSMALELLRRRKLAGHQLVAFDPHAHPNKWPDCDVVGSGLNFLKIEQSIESLQTLIKTRYEQIGKGQIAPCQFPPITFVMEEMTDWQSSVPNAGLLILKAGDYRKANIHLILVAHGDSMSQIGAPSGSNEVIKNCVTKLRLFSKPGSNGNPIPAMRGELTFPLSQTISVKIPKLTPVQINHQVESEPTVSPVELDQTSLTTTKGHGLVKAQRFQHPTLDFSYTEPPILEFLEVRPDLKAIVSLVCKNQGCLDARTIRQRANSNSALQFNGVALATDEIRNRFIELKDSYPGSFELHNQGNSLTVKDPILFSMVNAHSSNP